MDVVGKRKLTHNGWPLHHNMSTFGEGTMNSIVFYSQCPMHHHRLPCAMASSDGLWSKGTKRVGWYGGGGHI